jgi:hypothetical protein
LERDREAFRNQDRANVAPVRFQRAAAATVIACRCSFCSWRTRASNKFEIKIAIPDKIANATRRFGS